MGYFFSFHPPDFDWKINSGRCILSVSRIRCIHPSLSRSSSPPLSPPSLTLLLFLFLFFRDCYVQTAFICAAGESDGQNGSFNIGVIATDKGNGCGEAWVSSLPPSQINTFILFAGEMDVLNRQPEEQRREGGDRWEGWGCIFSIKRSVRGVREICILSSTPRVLPEQQQRWPPCRLKMQTWQIVICIIFIVIFSWEIT